MEKNVKEIKEENILKEDKVEKPIPKKNNSKKTKVILIILTLIILIGIGVFVYFKFIKKDTTNYFDIYRSTFKTSDGRKLRIYTYGDEEIMTEAEKTAYKNSPNYSVSRDILKEYAENSKITDYNNPNYVYSWASFDGKKIALYSEYYNMRYGVYAGNDIEKVGQYPYEYYFLLDFDTGKIIQYDEEIYLVTHYEPGHVSEISYFAKKDKTSPRYKIYTTDFKYLGDSLSTPYNLTNDNGYIYVVNDGAISSYDEKGNKKETLPSVGNMVDYTIFKNICLALIYENEKLYLYDYSNKSKTELTIDISYSQKKNITDNFFFLYNQNDIDKDQIVIYGARNGANTITDSYGNFAVYDYTSKSLKKTYFSDVYTNGKTTIELEKYDSETNEDNIETNYYYMYYDGKTIKVKDDYRSNVNKDIISVTNTNCVAVINTKTKELLAFYTSKSPVSITPEFAYDSVIEWYEVYEYGMVDFGKLISVSNNINGEVLRLSNEIAKGILTIDNEFYIAYDKKIVKYDVTGKPIETLTFDDYYPSRGSTIFGALLGESFAKKDGNYYMIDIIDKGFKMNKLDKTALVVGDSGTVFVYKLGDRAYIYEDGAFAEVDLTPSKEDDVYALYPQVGGMCQGGFIVDKKSGKIVRSGDDLGYDKTSKGYYFYDTDCTIEITSPDAYTTTGKRIGELFAGLNSVNSDGNLYVINSNYIEIRTVFGELIERSKAYKILGWGLIKDNILYIVIEENNKDVLLSLNTKFEELSRTEIRSSLDDIYYYYLELKDNKIEVSLFDYDYGETYLYDPNTKQIEKVINEDE